MNPGWLDELNRPEADFAVLRRQGAVEILTGSAQAYKLLSDLPVDHRGPVAADRSSADVLAMVPYRQLAERGYACRDDAEPLLGLRVQSRAEVPLEEFLAACPAEDPGLTGAAFDLDDDAYAELVRSVIEEDIASGEAVNFVVHRVLTGHLAAWSTAAALSVFARLLSKEGGAYWTFVVRMRGRTWIGASPERHVSLRDGEAVMNPISGTFRYPGSEPEEDDVLAFLADLKETEELYMVLDEELKTMAALCPDGGRIHGPWLKEMAHLAHTGYLLKGACPLDGPEVLSRSLFAPTVTGSPVRNACRVIARREPAGRGYYSGVIALFGRDESEHALLDSAIVIRTADVSAAGHLRLGVGATVVRHSRPADGAAETAAKATGVLAAFRGDTGPAVPAPRRPGMADRPAIASALAERNDALASFWLRGIGRPDQVFAGKRLLLIDAEDDFTAMLTLQLESLGLEVDLRRHHEDIEPGAHDLVMLGPGPGDPADLDDARISRLRDLALGLLAGAIPLAGVCLGHQVIASLLGLRIRRLRSPGQGRRQEINLFGRAATAGFYNSFAAYSMTDTIICPHTGRTVRVSRDRNTGEVHALAAPGLATMQFHPESVLTRDGPGLLAAQLRPLLIPVLA